MLDRQDQRTDERHALRDDFAARLEGHGVGLFFHRPVFLLQTTYRGSFSISRSATSGHVSP